MGRKAVSLKMNVEKFREIIGEFSSFSEIAQKYGVTRQAVNSWLESGRIPPRALSEISKDLDLDPQDIRDILDVPERKRKRTFVITCTIEESDK